MDSGINRWWIAPRWGEKYEQGVDKYIEKAFSTKSQGNQICCPCECCHYRYWRNENVVRDHLICNGFVPRTGKLSELGIDIQREATGSGVDERRNLDDSEDDVAGLLHDVREAFTEGPNGAFTCTFGDGKKFVMESMNSSWRVHKCRVKKKHYYPYDTDELRWANKSDTISVPHFKDLLEYWHCEKIQMMLPVIFSFLLLLMISPAYGSPEYCPVGGEVSQVIPVHTIHEISPAYGSREYCPVGGEVSLVIPVHTIHEISPAYGSREYCPVGGEVSQVI